MMIRRLSLVAALAALAALFAIPTPAAADGAKAGLHTIKAHTVYVRANPGGYVIGTMFAGRSEHFDVIKTSTTQYVWGYAGGDVHTCGWVPASALNPVKGAGHAPTCNPPRFAGTGAAARAYMQKFYSTRINGLPGGGTKITTPASAPQTFLYANFHPGSGLADPYTNLPIGPNTQVRWRYVTKAGPGGQAVLVEYAKTWGFIPIASLPQLA